MLKPARDPKFRAGFFYGDRAEDRVRRSRRLWVFCPLFFLDKSAHELALLGCVAKDLTPSLDARLRARLAAGDELAFGELYEWYGPRLYRAALGLLGRREDAEDCVQEVFAALVRSRRSLAGVHDLAAYLFVALRRQAFRSTAQRRRQPATLATETPVSKPPVPDPRATALAAALQTLPAEQREVIALKIEGQLTFAEIGRLLSISPNTAASRYRYALERLRDRLNPEGNAT